MTTTNVTHAKVSPRAALAAGLFAAAALFAGTLATPASAGTIFSASHQVARAWTGDLGPRGVAADVMRAGSDFSASEQFARAWTGQLADRGASGTYLAQAGTHGTEAGMEAESARPVGRSGPDYWGASLARDAR